MHFETYAEMCRARATAWCPQPEVWHTTGRLPLSLTHCGDHLLLTQCVLISSAVRHQQNQQQVAAVIFTGATTCATYVTLGQCKLCTVWDRSTHRLWHRSTHGLRHRSTQTAAESHTQAVAQIHKGTRNSACSAPCTLLPHKVQRACNYQSHHLKLSIHHTVVYNAVNAVGPSASPQVATM